MSPLLLALLLAPAPGEVLKEDIFPLDTISGRRAVLDYYVSHAPEP